MAALAAGCGGETELRRLDWRLTPDHDLADVGLPPRTRDLHLIRDANMRIAFPDGSRWSGAFEYVWVSRDKRGDAGDIGHIQLQTYDYTVPAACRLVARVARTFDVRRNRNRCRANPESTPVYYLGASSPLPDGPVVLLKLLVRKEHEGRPVAVAIEFFWDDPGDR